MRKVFLCSLCHKGILGGGLYLEPQALTFRTNKLTVNEKYRNLVLPLEEMEHFFVWLKSVILIVMFYMLE